MNQFVETKRMFESAVGVKYPLSYEGWLAVKDDLKAIALYVQFYDAITLAWTKARSEFTPDEDGVSILMQYLIKNVPIITGDKKKYNSQYIYRVAYNCMGCLRRVQRDADRYNLTQSNIVGDSDDEFDLFEKIIGDESDLVEYAEKRRYETEIQCIIEALDEDSKKLVEYLLGGKKLGKRVEAKKETIMADFRIKFAKYRNTYCGFKEDDTLRFARVLEIDDSVSSAVVEMPNGVKAVYYGETVIGSDGVVRVVFFGPERDYLVPIKSASRLKVLNIELY